MTKKNKANSSSIYKAIELYAHAKTPLTTSRIFSQYREEGERGPTERPPYEIAWNIRVNSKSDTAYRRRFVQRRCPKTCCPKTDGVRDISPSRKYASHPDVGDIPKTPHSSGAFGSLSSFVRFVRFVGRRICDMVEKRRRMIHGDGMMMMGCSRRYLLTKINRLAHNLRLQVTVQLRSEQVKDLDILIT